MSEKVDKIKTSSRSRQTTNVAHTSFIHTKGEQSFFAPANSTSSTFIQPRLQISKPGDPMEKEADQTADKVMRMNETSVQRFASAPGDEDVQRKCADCEKEEKLQRKEEEEEVQPKLSVNNGGALVQRMEEKEEPVQTKMEEAQVQRKEEEEEVQPKMLQRAVDDNKKEDEEPIQPKLAFLARKERGPPQISPQFTNSLHSIKGSGYPMDNGTRSFMESRFNADFSGVRVHTDASAVQMNSQISAQAFTHGNNIYFNSGKYNPDSGSGKHLLAHELTHTIQQGKSKSVQPFLSTEINRSTDNSSVNEEKEEPIQAKEETGTKSRPELQKAVAYAKSQIGKVNAQQKNKDGTRTGWERLKEYFQLAMGQEKVIPEGGIQTNGSILEKNIKYSGTTKGPPPNVANPPKSAWVNKDVMPSWCGIFVFWSLNKGGVPMPKWTIGGNAVKLKAVHPPGHIPKPGDIAYFEKNSHYAIVEKTEPENPSPSERKKIKVVTVNGNTAGEDNLGGQVQVKTHPINHWLGFFNPLYGIEDKMPPNPQELSDAELQKIIGDTVALATGSSVKESEPAAVIPYTPELPVSAPGATQVIKEEETKEQLEEVPAESKEETAPAAEEMVETSPKTPGEDPAYKAIVAKTGQLKKQQKTHDTPESKAAAAQKASEIPEELNIGSQAKMHQVNDMNQQQAKPFNAADFKNKLMERVRQALPKNDTETVDMYEHPSDGKKRMEQAKTNAKGDVKEEKDKAGNAISTTAKADPATKNKLAIPKETEGMQNEDAGKKPYVPDAEAAAPKPKTDSEISMEKDAQQLDNNMAESNVTEAQLEKSNEPEFTGALQNKREAQQQARNAPSEYRAQEEPAIAKAEEQARATVGGKMEDMHGARSELFGKVDESKTGTKGKDEAKRKEIAEKLESIYNETKTKVDTILNQLETDVTNDFDSAANAANAVFEKRVNERLDDHYGITTVDDTISEYFSGLSPEIDKIFREEKDRYIESMDGAITAIANKVEKQLTAAMAEITTGKGKLDEFWNKLDPGLQKIGEEARQEVLGKFEELEKSVQDKHDALIEKLSDKYVQNVNKLQETFDKIKESKKGWLSGAIDAIAGVIKAILRLKDMLFETLAKVAHVVGQIISDPIGFLGQLVTAVKMGLNNFIDNIVHHFKVGFFEWLLGNMPPGIVFPDKWDLPGIFHFVMQILGLTWGNIRSRAVKKLGEPVVAALEEVFEIFQIIRKEGLAGLWRYIKGKIGDLKKMIIDAIQDMLIKEIVKAGIKFILSLLNPVGAFIKACMTIYEIVMFFVRNGKRILDLINAIIDSVALIVQGSLDGAAKMVENALAKLIPITIGFLASLLGLGNISEKAQKIIKAIQSPINKAIDWVLDKAIALTKKLGLDKVVKKIKGGVQGAKDWAKKKVEKGKEKIKEKVEALMEWLGFKQKFKLKNGQEHSIYFTGTAQKAILMVASDPTPVEKFLSSKMDKDSNAKGAYNYYVNTVKTQEDKVEQKEKQYKQEADKDKKRSARYQHQVEVQTLRNTMKSFSDLLTLVNFEGSTLGIKTKVDKFPRGSRAGTVRAWPLTYLPGNETGSPPSQDPEGWSSYAQNASDKWVRGHLLSEHLYGPGVSWNLTPISQSVNSSMSGVEEQVKPLINNQESLHYYITVVDYDDDRKDPNDPNNSEAKNIPTSVKITWGTLKQKQGEQNKFIPEETHNEGPFTQGLPTLTGPPNLNNIGSPTIIRNGMQGNDRLAEDIVICRDSYTETNGGFEDYDDLVDKMEKYYAKQLTPKSGTTPEPRLKKRPSNIAGVLYNVFKKESKIKIDKI